MSKLGLVAMLALAATLSGCAVAGDKPVLEPTSRVTRVVVDQRDSPAYGGQSFGDVGQYEVLRGRIFGELDPADKRNAIINDLQLAPRNAAGRVEYIASFMLHKPVNMAKWSGGILADSANRGNRRAFDYHNAGPNPGDNARQGTGFEPGDGFLFKQGLVVLAVGWQGDVPNPPSAAAPYEANTMSVLVPVAKNADGSAVTGPLWARFAQPTGNTVSLGKRNGSPLTLDTASASLTKMPPEAANGLRTGPETPIAPTDWAFADCRTVPFPGVPDPTRICVRDPFDSTLVYIVRYTAKDPLVLGVGHAAFRDAISFFKWAGVDATGMRSPLGAQPAKYVVAYGSSQSGNMLRAFLHLGFNEDASGRAVLDGMDSHVATRLNPMNFRFAAPSVSTALYEPGMEGVLWWEARPDPLRNLPTAGMLDRCRATKTCPKIFETTGSSEFYSFKASPNFVGSSADVDIPVPPEVRRYYFPSVRHEGGTGGFNVTGASGCVVANPNPEKEQERALLVAMREWIVDGTQPPASRYPTLSGGGLVARNRVAMGMPLIPGMTDPATALNEWADYDMGPRFKYVDMSGEVTTAPPIIKRILPSLVPRTDADGNEIDGVKSVNLMAPLGTYVGWNCGAGGFVPFARTAEERAPADPRPSLEERYGSRANFLSLVSSAVKTAVGERFLLPQDAQRVLDDANAGNVLK